MHLVRDSDRALPPLGRRFAQRLAATALVAAAVLAGCGGESGEGSASGGGIQLSAPINLADCRDWNEGSVDERLGTIRQIREFTGGPVQGTGGTGAVLDDEEAYELFENYCENEFARGFKLYKLYGRAAAFSGASTSGEPGKP